MPDGDMYAALGVAPDATGPEIQAAYQRLTRQLATGEIPASERPAIEQAYATLGDPIRRLRHDAQATAPAPARFQMPSVGLPSRRVSVHAPTLRPGLPAFARRIDPMVGVLVGLVGLVAVVVLVLLLRGGGKPGAPAQSVADLVPTATTVATTAPATVAPTGTQAARRPTAPSGGANGSSPGSPGAFNPFSPPGQGSGLLPFGPGGAAAGIPPLVTPGASPPGGALTQTSEPPFLTSAALVDSLRAVIAASAVRNGPSQGAITPPVAGAAPSSSPTSPIAASSSLPPVVTGPVPSIPPATTFAPSAGQSSAGASAGQGVPAPETGGNAGTTEAASPGGPPPPNLPTPAPPTPRPAPNHISVPTVAPASVVASPRPSAPTIPSGPVSAASTPGPNRLATPVH